MDKKQLTERDICTKYITPALEKSGWYILTQIREEFPLTNRRIQSSFTQFGTPIKVRGLLLPVTVLMAFMWSRSDIISLLFGQINFFPELSSCFYHLHQVLPNSS